MPENHHQKREPIAFVKLEAGDEAGIKAMSSLAVGIVREHYDPIIGREQNDYMIEKFQSPDAIRRQIGSGYQYYFVRTSGRNIGFLAFFPRGGAMYLSKLYLLKDERGKGYSRRMVDFVVGKAKEAGLDVVELNVNRYNDSIRVYEKLGFTVTRTEKNDIGCGFFMDDYVYALNIGNWRSSFPENS